MATTAVLISYHLRDVIEAKERYTRLKDKEDRKKRSKIKYRCHLSIRNILFCGTRQDSHE